jgi:hypothetical protein
LVYVTTGATFVCADAITHITKKNITQNKIILEARS